MITWKVETADGTLYILQANTLELAKEKFALRFVGETQPEATWTQVEGAVSLKDKVFDV